MKTPVRDNLVHALFATAALATLAAQAADPGYFEQQRQVTDGYDSEYNNALAALFERAEKR